MEEIELVHVATSSIQEKSLDFSVRYRLEDPALEERIRRAGWVSPLTGIQAEGGFALIDGFRRWRIVQKLGWDRVPFLCLSESIPEKERFLLSVALQGSTPLRDLDRCLGIRKAGERFALSEEEILEWVMPSLGLPRSLNIMRSYYQMSSVETEILDLIDQGEVPFRVGEELAQWRSEERLAIVRALVPVCCFNQNEFLAVIESIRDLALREKENVQGTLDRSELQDILKHPGWDHRERARQLMRVLHRMRFPQLSEWEEKFEELAREVKLGDKITVEKPSYFEGASFVIRLKVHSYEHLVSVLARLEEKKSLWSEFLPREGSPLP